MRHRTLLPALLFVGACASEVEWSKPGVDAQQIERDKAACTRQIPRVGAGGTTFRINVVEPKCMQALGYTQR
jgi:hypothetical protein